jgi:hypothetical protein
LAGLLAVVICNFITEMVNLTPELLFVLYLLLQEIKQAYQRSHVILNTYPVNKDINTEMCKVAPAVDQFGFKLQNLETQNYT